MVIHQLETALSRALGDDEYYDDNDELDEEYYDDNDELNDGYYDVNDDPLRPVGIPTSTLPPLGTRPTPTTLPPLGARPTATEDPSQPTASM